MLDFSETELEMREGEKEHKRHVLIPFDEERNQTRGQHGLIPIQLQPDFVSLPETQSLHPHFIHSTVSHTPQTWAGLHSISHTRLTHTYTRLLEIGTDVKV